MNASHRVGKMEGEGDGADLCYNLKGPEVFFCEFLKGLGSMDVIRLNKDFISDLEVWWRSPTSVCRDQVSFLRIRYVGLELLVQVIEVNCKVSGPGRGNVAFRVDGDARMITLVGVEWSHACYSVQSVVISKLHQQ